MQHIQSFPQYKDNIRTYTVDFNVQVGKLGTTVSSVVWTVEDGSATIASEALASSVASALITTGTIGCALIKVVPTFANGGSEIHYFKLDVNEPGCISNSVGRNRY